MEGMLADQNLSDDAIVLEAVVADAAHRLSELAFVLAGVEPQDVVVVEHAAQGKKDDWLTLIVEVAQVVPDL